MEDNSDLAAKVKKVATRLGWHVLLARSLEGAKRLCDDPGLRIDAALIDLMIPSTEDELQDVDRWLVERNRHSLVITSKGTTSQGPSHARQEAILAITSIDKEIAKRIVDDGGVTFLQSEQAGRFFRGPAAKPVAIFSARTEGTEDQNDRDGLQTKVRNVLGGRDPDMWFVKPASSLDLEQWLKRRLPPVTP